ncbi:MAG: tRNA lysidine(34) synthetase TilS [Paludibacter sp.]|nr:tRNA lysidine(34) synthetase TilS [Paludibacter sp.]
MLQKIRKYIEKNNLAHPEDKIIVGVSGGADSVALLHILRTFGYNCIAAHCNFHLRMEESDRDELFVRALCSELNIPIHIIDFETSKYAEEKRVSIEMAARELRYNWFEKLCNEQGAQHIAIAHHADDNIETLLMNIVRGTGIKGMTGIPVKNGRIIRPLLNTTRNEIYDYLMKYDLNYVVDSTNAMTDYTRNKFRHQVIPLLEEINPSVRKTLYETIERFNAIEKVYNSAVTSQAVDMIVPTANGSEIDLDKLTNLPDRQVFLFEYLYEYGFHPDTIQQIGLSVDKDPGQIFYSENYKILHDRNKLLLTDIAKPEEQVTGILYINTEISQPIKIKCSLINIDNQFKISKSNTLVYLDVDKITFPLKVRKWINGDYFYPLGMNNRKKISDFLIDNKIDRFTKENIYVLESDGEIVWLIGLRIDNRFKISDKSVHALALELKT